MTTTPRTPRLALALVALLAAGCVQNRTARNGVFNENQYVRKDFLIRGADASQSDPGWFVRATITSVSTPNPFGADIFLTPGLESGTGGAQLVRFQVTEDHLQILNQRELDSRPSDARTPEVVNSWPVTNVDLKYRVNLDGETTNFYEENQELDWQQRQWVKVKFAKNDMSDLAPFGSFFTDVVSTCADIGSTVATLVPNSFRVDTANDYMEWTTSITLPIKWDNPLCVQAYGPLGVEAAKFGRNAVTFNLKYSFMRARPLPQSGAAPKDGEVTYQPLEVAEKDPIRHKYGIFDWTVMARDNGTGNLGARQLLMRFDPQKPIVWYFAPGFPAEYKKFFRPEPGQTGGPITIQEHTNKLFTDAGVASRISFKEYDEDLAPGQAPRQYGDVRYNMLYWMTDRDTQGGFAGLTEFTTDPRTGETLSASIIFNDFPVKDYYAQRIDAYLSTIGATSPSMGSGTGGVLNDPAPWQDPPGDCADGQQLPLVPDAVAAQHNASSTVYGKMQQYLQRPASLYGNLGPQDFVATQDDDFYRAYYAILPYMIFSDPNVNQFVIPEGGNGVYGPTAFWQGLQDEKDFQDLAARVDRGEAPYDGVEGPQAMQNALGFLSKFKDLTLAHDRWQYTKTFLAGGLRTHLDAPDAFSLEQVMAHDSRHCIKGKWETKQEWVNNLITTYWSQVAWHEFGHSLGLTHNFMASVDKNNFPTYMDGSGNAHYGLYASSVMEYNSAPDRVFWNAGWAPYDQGAISWIYGNAGGPATASCGQDADCGYGRCDCTNGLCGASPPGGVCTPKSITGQLDPGRPWKDPKGFLADGKTENIFLMCNEQHMAYTPLCRQGDLGATPSQIIANAIDSYEWQYAWRNFRQYHKYWDLSAYASQPASLFIQMRRFLPLWAFDWGGAELSDSFRRIGLVNPDPNGSALEYYTQLTNKFNLEASQANQLVAAFHKAIIQQSSGERPFRTIFDKFYGDTTQQGIILDKLFAMQGFVALWPINNYDPNQAGGYFSFYEGLGDSSFDYVAKDAVTSMVGGQYDVYPYFVPLAVLQFAQDTHSPSFFGNIEVRDWIGGHVFTRYQDFLDYWRKMAIDYSQPGCTDLRTCNYDPTQISDTHNEFVAPDRKRYIWSYVPDRNTWVVAAKERNSATYIILRAYNDDVVFQLDDGNFPGGAYGTLLPVKYFLDSFNYFN